MSLSSFLKKQKPICTKSPLFKIFEQNTGLYALLARRSRKDFNENLFGRQCGRYLLCTDECMGRPIPMYDELKPYLHLLDNYKVSKFKGKDVWVTYATLCKHCPFASDCTETCGTVEDFLVRDIDMDEPLGERLTPLTGREEETFSVDYATVPVGFDSSDVPWSCLTEMQDKVIRLRVYDGMDYQDIADELGISKKVAWTHFTRGIKKLKKNIDS